jgi:large subunit ribosomal protein L4
VQGGAVIVVDALAASEVKTRAAVAMLKTIGVSGKALLVDVTPDEKLALSVRNVPGVALLPSNRITARDVANTRTVVVTQAALAKLEAALG